jgi:integrase
VRKCCTCPRRRWSKCPHAWNFNFKLRGGRSFRFSLDAELDRHIETKEEALTAADQIRDQIRAGTFVRAAERRRNAGEVAATAGAVTFEQFAEIYVKRVSEVRERNTSWKNDRSQFAQMAKFELENHSRFGTKPIRDITEDDLEALVVWLRRKGRAASTRNHYVHLLKAAFRWATKKGYLDRNPISEDSALKRAKVAQRNRRLIAETVDETGNVKQASEEHRLLAAAAPRLQNLIIAALETCCRRGELLSLQWRDVDLHRREVIIRAENAKDRDVRVLPISSRLLAVLEMAKTDPAGHDYDKDDYVFGELGNKVENVKKIWATCVLKAHGHEPTWQKTALASESRARLKAIDLHFHDLRHEGASRLLEAGWPLHHVQEMLGHASIEQTSVYLNVQRGGLHESMRKFELLPSRCRSVADSPENDRLIAENSDEEMATKPRVN